MLLNLPNGSNAQIFLHSPHETPIPGDCAAALREERHPRAKQNPPAALLHLAAPAPDPANPLRGGARLLPVLSVGTEAGRTSPVPPRLSPRSPMLRIAYQMLFRPGRGKYLPVPLPALEAKPPFLLR